MQHSNELSVQPEPLAAIEVVEQQERRAVMEQLEEPRPDETGPSNLVLVAQAKADLQAKKLAIAEQCVCCKTYGLLTKVEIREENVQAVASNERMRGADHVYRHVRHWC